MNLDQAFQTFLDESRELLVEMEGILLELERVANSELYHALFRCVHTIKGSAGMFGLNQVVLFTHVVENVLDRLRLGDIEFTRALSSALLQCRDHMATLIELNQQTLSEAGQFKERLLLEELASWQERECVNVDRKSWHISLRFDPHIFVHGMDPISFIVYLKSLGELTCVTTLTDHLPTVEDLDPEMFYLGFEIDFCGAVEQSEIEQVFEFCEELCELRILPPGSDWEDYWHLIESLPEDSIRLTELFFESGHLSRNEFEQCLAREVSAREPNVSNSLGMADQNQVRNSGRAEASEVSLSDAKSEMPRNSNTHVKVNAEKLDQLINLVGEMVIATSAVSLNANQGGDVATRESAAALNLLVEEIRDRSLQLRMVPIGETFARFKRVVRDIATELDKDIVLNINGGETELDKTVVEKIADPLTHLIRNACDHGIEPKPQRIAKQKAPAGTIKLDAYHESGAIVIEVEDDGAGLNVQAIHRKAVERGIVPADETLDESEILNLIFEPGFSTATEVTSLSGRGVGLDVVKRNIEALRGSVEVESNSGNGTRFRIRLPLTLAIIDGFLATVAEVAYVVPLEMIDECMEYDANLKGNEGNGSLLNLRGEVLPLVDLRYWFGSSSDVPSRRNILVVQYAGNKAGLIVDELLGEHQTVIKPLNRIFSGITGLAGSTILGNGKVALILDVSGLLQKASREDENGPSMVKFEANSHNQLSLY